MLLEHLKKYPYKESIIDYLKYKTSLFLINHFDQIFKNLGKSRKIKKNEYQFETLNQKVKLKCLLAGYHTSKPPSNNTVPSEKNGGGNATFIFCRSIYSSPIWTMVYITKSGSRMPF